MGKNRIFVWVDSTLVEHGRASDTFANKGTVPPRSELSNDLDRICKRFGGKSVGMGEYDFEAMDDARGFMGAVRAKLPKERIRFQQEGGAGEPDGPDQVWPF